MSKQKLILLLMILGINSVTFSCNDDIAPSLDENLENAHALQRHPPEPLGGWQNFYGTIEKNIAPHESYAKIGINTVIVEFLVDEVGELSNFKVVKGLHHEFDQEAIRVISLTKWAPAKQYGHSVNANTIVAINF